jgi:hypothetical protein
MTEADIDDLLADIEQQVLQVGFSVACTSTVYAQQPATNLAAPWQLLPTLIAQQHSIHWACNTLVWQLSLLCTHLLLAGDPAGAGST